MDEAIGNPGLTRASLFKMGAVTALAIGTASGGRVLAGEAGSLLTGPSDGPLYLRRATFAPRVGDLFRISRPDRRPLPVRLVQVTTLPSKGEAFSLLFRARRNAKLEQGTYSFHHGLLGTFPFFVVPVGRGVVGQDFQVVVNRVAVPGGTRG